MISAQDGGCVGWWASNYVLGPGAGCTLTAELCGLTATENF